MLSHNKEMHLSFCSTTPNFSGIFRIIVLPFQAEIRIQLIPFGSFLYPSLKLIGSYKFIKVVILIVFSDQIRKLILQPTYEFRAEMVIIEMQKLVDLIVNNSENFRFWFTPQMLRIEKNCSRSHSSHVVEIFTLFMK